jgi:hypothetical protein
MVHWLQIVAAVKLMACREIAERDDLIARGTFERDCIFKEM